MKLSDIFEEHGIARVSVWTEGAELASVVADGPDLEPLFLSEAVCEELDEKVLEFLKTQKCYEYNVLEFQRSKGVVYIKDGQPAYCGDVQVRGELLPFSEHWLSETEMTNEIYCSK